MGLGVLGLIVGCNLIKIKQLLGLMEISLGPVQIHNLQNSINLISFFFQSFGKSFTSVSSFSLAYEGNHLSVFVTISQTKIPWIIDSGASDHMIDAYNLFSSHSPCVGNLKVRIVDGFLSVVVRKMSIRILNCITLNFVLHFLNLSCNLISISQLTTSFHCSTKYFSSYCIF